MQISSVSIIKKELQHLPQEELIQLCLRLAKFKKENKELLNFTLFLEKDKDHFTALVKEDIDEQFMEINRSNFHLIKKSVRKIFRETKKQIRIASDPEVEIELLMHLCYKLKTFMPSIQNNFLLTNLFNRTLEQITKKMEKLHEDLQYDFQIKLDKLID